MKKTETKKALADKTPAELQTELEALLKEQFGLRMQAATQQLKDNSKLKTVRRGIARVRTLMHQKAQAAAGNKEAKHDRTADKRRKGGGAGRKALIQTIGAASSATR